MPRLALAYLRDRALLSGLNVLLLGLAVAMLVILLSFSTQLSERFQRDAAGIDLVVGAKGSPLQLILSSVYHVDTPTGNIPLASIELLRRDPTVARVIPLALGDNFRGFRIVGTEEAYTELYDAELAQGRMFGDHAEAVLGAEVARSTGAQVGQQFVGSHGLAEEGGGEHEAHPFETVGILAPTGTVIDRLILVSVESVWDVHGITHDDEHADEDHADHDESEHAEHEADHEHEAEHDADHEHDAEHEQEEEGANAATLERPAGLDPEVTALLVTYRSAAGAVRLPGMINRQTDMQAAVPAVETTRLLSMLGVGIEGARLFGWLLALVGGLSIFVALLNAASAREGDLALLRMMGANRPSIFGTIITEGVIIAAAGAVFGIIIGHGALALAASAFDPVREMGLDPLRFETAELTIVVAVIGIGVVAAIVPALRIFRTDLSETLARTA